MMLPAIADEEPASDNTDETVVEQVEEESSEQNSTEKEEKEPDKDETEKEPVKDETKTDSQEKSGNTKKSGNIKKEVITGSSDKSERDPKKGIIILIGNAKTVRHDENEDEVIGFLNADRITLKQDLDTGETKEIIAEGNVEIRDDKIFATCDHATMDNITNIITLKDNVVVLQDNDRLETKLFTFNRITGKQTGIGDVKFRVTVTQTVPDETEDSGEESENESGTSGEGEENSTTPETEGNEEKESEDKVDADKEEDSSDETSEETKDGEKDKDVETESDETEETEPDESEGTESDDDEPTEPEKTEDAETETEDEDKEESPKE